MNLWEFIFWVGIAKVSIHVCCVGIYSTFEMYIDQIRNILYDFEPFDLNFDT